MLHVDADEPKLVEETHDEKNLESATAAPVTQPSVRPTPTAGELS